MKYKAKRLDNGEWIEGYYFKIGYSHYIEDGLGRAIKVDPSTFCQQVRGTEFFEGDEVYSRTADLTGILEYSDNSFSWNVTYDQELFPFNGVNDWKPTGKNKHDL